MTDVLQIPLGAGDGDGIEVIVVLVFVAFSIISGLLQKSSKAKKAAQEQEQARERRSQRVTGQAPPARARAGLQLVAVASPPARTVQPPPARAARRGPEVRAADRIGLKPNRSSLEDRYVGSAHLGRLSNAEVSVAVREGLLADLSTVEAARQAMIYHEVFSLPKALRQGKELWEM